MFGRSKIFLLIAGFMFVAGVALTAVTAQAALDPADRAERITNNASGVTACKESADAACRVNRTATARAALDGDGGGDEGAGDDECRDGGAEVAGPSVDDPDDGPADADAAVAADEGGGCRR